jgi:hypothetical protein
VSECEREREREKAIWFVLSRVLSRQDSSQQLQCYLKELLPKKTLEVIYQEHDINKIFSNVLRIYLNIFEASFPVIDHVKYKENAWITRDIRISCQWKRSLYHLIRNCNDLELKINYKHYCTVLGRVVREAKNCITWN